MTKWEQVQLEEIASSKLQAVNSWYMVIGIKNMAPSKTQKHLFVGPEPISLVSTKPDKGQGLKHSEIEEELSSGY